MIVDDFIIVIIITAEAFVQGENGFLFENSMH